MRGPRSSTPLLLLIALAAASGCNASDPRACTVVCGSAGQCPDNTRCGDDGYCYAADQVPGSCTLVVDPDGAPPPIDGGRDPRADGAPIDPVDAAPDDPDAAPPPDADPCAGIDDFASSRTPLVFIPDDDPVGVTSSIQVNTDCITVRSVEVSVNITHVYRGDVSIELTSPSGDTELLLASDPDDSAENIDAFFDAFVGVGENAQGLWRLTVADNIGDLTGSFDRWSIGINRPAP